MNYKISLRLTVFNCIAASLIATLAQQGHAQTYMPQKNGQFYLPDEWLLGSGQTFHYRVPATSGGRPLGSREPTRGERNAVDRISELFAASESKVLLLGDGSEIVDMRLKAPAREDGLLLSASIDKSVTAFSAGIAVCDGKIALDTLAGDVLPELAGTDIGKTTLRDNLKMASGTTRAFDDSQSLTAEETADMQSGRKSFMDFLKGRLGVARFWTKPGERFDYKSQDPLLVGMMVTAAYGMHGKKFREWQTEYFFPKVQTSDRRIQGTDRFAYAQSDGNTRMTLKDWARLAVFIQASRKSTGCYGDFIREATSTQIQSDRRFAKMYNGYGYFTWTDNQDIPNSYSALGYGGQAIVWSTTNDKYIVVFSNSTSAREIHRMAKLWLESQ